MVDKMKFSISVYVGRSNGPNLVHHVTDVSHHELGGFISGLTHKYKEADAGFWLEVVPV